MKLKIDKRHLAKLSAKIVGKAERAFKGSKRSLVKEVVKKYVGDIRNKSLNTNTNSPYDGLKDSTVKHRKYLAKNNNTHSKYQLKKPNLTLTGELLDAVVGELRKSGKTGRLNLILRMKKGKHKKYKSSKGKRIGKNTSSYNEISKGLRKLGRPIFMADQEYLVDNILPILEKYLRKTYKRKTYK